MAGATNRNVYLPAGATWYDFWTGQTYAGGQTIAATAPIQTMPLYVRAGSIIPYGPDIQYATQTTDPIELRVYRGANGNFTLYEDEGDNYNYETGSYATIPITWNDLTQTLTIGNAAGEFSGNVDEPHLQHRLGFVRTWHGRSQHRRARSHGCLYGQCDKCLVSLKVIRYFS